MQVRFVEITCTAAQATCSGACNDGERVMSAYAVSPGGTLVYDDERRITFRPARRGAGKAVVACVPE